MSRAGERRERVTFQQRGLDANGDRLGAFASDFSRWARVQALKGGEPVLQSRLRGVQPVQITVLRDSDTTTVTTAWRFTWNSTDYNIRAIAPSEDRSEIVMLADDDGSNG